MAYLATRTELLCSKSNLLAMRMGPGKHLKGKELMGGLVKPEEVNFCRLLVYPFHSPPAVQFDYFHEVRKSNV